jgi:hypothetical protein
VSKSHTVVNTFVVGNIGLTLTESTGSEYVLVPGCSVTKDPRVTVTGYSEECWLFVKIGTDDITESLIDYSIADGWNALSEESNLYWRQVPRTSQDSTWGILNNDSFLVDASITEERLASLDEDIKLTFTAYAIQCEGILTPDKAWEIIKSKGDEV